MLQVNTKTISLRGLDLLTKEKRNRKIPFLVCKNRRQKNYDPQLRQPSGLSSEQDISSMACALSVAGIFCFVMDESTVNFTASVAALVLR